MTGWTVTRDRYRPAGGTVQDFTYFNAGTGIYTTPARGVYHCCAYFRGKQGGYYDFTFIRNAGQGDVTYAAFGTRNTGPTQNGWWVSRRIFYFVRLFSFILYSFQLLKLL